MGGFYENDIFCEIGEFGKGFITCKGLAKKFDGTTKEAYWQLAIFAKMANLRKGGIVQESIKGLAKLQLKWQRGESWQMAIIIRKWQIKEKKANFDKNGECAKNSSRVWPNIRMR